MSIPNNNLQSPVEKIKKESHGLRGNIVPAVKEPITGSVPEDVVQLVKFHGMYLQDDRDRREVRAEKKLERLYSFMIRLRLPGGVLTPDQWLALHHIAGEHSTGVIKITTRQTVQLHGVYKSHVKPTLQAFNAAKLDSIATCGDINRNVTAAAHPVASPLHEKIHGYADKISTMLMPKTRAYYEIWLDEEKLGERISEEDPLYQERYLPRKFKIGIGIPPNNDVDVLTNDLGLIAIIENNELKGFNIAVGGGLSATHGNEQTYPRLASVLGYVSVENGDENFMKAIYEVLTVQRDFGYRGDRKLARVKYTIDRLGVDGYREELEKRTGFKLEPAKPFQFTERKDWYGWNKNHKGLWYYTAFVENGRITDDVQSATKSALYLIAQTGKAMFRFTGNQNITVGDVLESDKAEINAILEKFNVTNLTDNASAIRRNSIACVAFNTCPLALAEAQRYLPTLITKLEPVLAKYNLADDEIIIRMTGCPNGCGRSPAAEIGLVGTSYGHYNLHIGGDRIGTRLNTKVADSLNEEQILNHLDGLFASYSTGKHEGETLGDFANRTLSNVPVS
ncbi:MAG: NADPH-dependent assimilatory sulfite reductase hemoprotein subunit [Bacteroidota bacterium]